MENEHKVVVIISLAQEGGFVPVNVLNQIVFAPVIINYRASEYEAAL